MVKRMKKFSNFLDKIPFIGNKVNKQAENESSNNVDKQYRRGLELLYSGVTVEAISQLEQVANANGFEYKQTVCEALRILGELFEFGRYDNATIESDRDRAVDYYERFLKLAEDGEMFFKLGKIMLDKQSFSKAITYLEKASACGVKPATMKLGSIYEEGLNRIDEFGNKSDFVVPIDYEKAISWYKKLAVQGDGLAQSALDRVEYASTHKDSIQFEEKDKLYTQIAEKRKAKGIEFRFKCIEDRKSVV